jgi:hypothetical protein
MDNKIKIISTTLIPTNSKIRGGGEEQSLTDNIVKKISRSVEVSSEVISEQIANTINTVSSSIDKLGH